MMTLELIKDGGNICEVHGINNKTCKRSKKCKTVGGTTFPDWIFDESKFISKTTPFSLDEKNER